MCMRRQTCTVMAVIAMALTASAASTCDCEDEPYLPPDSNILMHHVISAAGVSESTVFRRNGIVYSHQDALTQAKKNEPMTAKIYHYPDDINCWMTITVGKGWKVLFQFPYEIKLACSSDGSTCDCLSIFDGQSLNDRRLAHICNNQEAGTVIPVYTTGHFATLSFRTDKNCRNDEGFRVKYSAFRYNSTQRCSDGEEFQCDGNRCIPETFKCDNHFQCVDETDEGSHCHADTNSCCLYGDMGGLTLWHLALFLTIILVIALLVMIGCCIWVRPCDRKHMRRRSTRVITMEPQTQPQPATVVETVDTDEPVTTDGDDVMALDDKEAGPETIEG